MAIWKRTKKNSNSSEPFNNKAKIYPLVILLLSCATPLAADPGAFSLRLLPAWNIPLSDSVIGPGISAAVALDYMPLNPLFLTLQGQYIQVSHQNLTPSHLFNASLGIGLDLRLSERFKLGFEVSGGLYGVAISPDTVVSPEFSSFSGISAAARLEASLRITPEFSLSAHSAIQHFAWNPAPYMNSLSVGLTAKLNLSKTFNKSSQMGVQLVKTEPVFPVFYSHYSEYPFSEAVVTNFEEDSIQDVTVSFYLEQYMSQPVICGKIDSLEAGESAQVPLKAFFNERILSLSEAINAQAQIIVEYKVLNASKKSTQLVELPIHHRNAMSWSDDRRAAAFVSARDPAVLWFSRHIASSVSERFRPGVNKNIQYAMGIFEALHMYGLNYVIDPASAYTDLSDSQDAIDFLQYPWQTLMYRGGDCDDLSILFCSLLEAIGIETAFLTVPGHIYMAFNTGMSEEEARKDFYAPDYLIYHQGQAWMPLEITLTKEGFNKAWRIGSKQWSDNEARGDARIFPLKEAWQLYKPVSVPGAVSRISLPDSTLIKNAFDTSIAQWVDREIQPQVQALASLNKNSTNNKPESQNNADQYNRLGVLYGSYGMLNPARTEFVKAARVNNVDAWINLGNLLFLETKYTEALSYYNRALTLEPNNPIAILGNARCYYELDQFENSDRLYSELSRTHPALANKYAYLGSFFESKGRAWSLADRLETAMWSLPEVPVQSENEPNQPQQESSHIASLAVLPSVTKLDIPEPEAEIKETAIEPPPEPPAPVVAVAQIEATPEPSPSPAPQIAASAAPAQPETPAAATAPATVAVAQPEATPEPSTAPTPQLAASAAPAQPETPAAATAPATVAVAQPEATPEPSASPAPQIVATAAPAQPETPAAATIPATVAVAQPEATPEPSASPRPSAAPKTSSGGLSAMLSFGASSVRATEAPSLSTTISVDDLLANTESETQTKTTIETRPTEAPLSILPSFFNEEAESALPDATLPSTANAATPAPSPAPAATTEPPRVVQAIPTSRPTVAATALPSIATQAPQTAAAAPAKTVSSEVSPSASIAPLATTTPASLAKTPSRSEGVSPAPSAEPFPTAEPARVAQANPTDKPAVAATAIPKTASQAPLPTATEAVAAAPPTISSNPTAEPVATAAPLLSDEAILKTAAPALPAATASPAIVTEETQATNDSKNPTHPIRTLVLSIFGISAAGIAGIFSARRIRSRTLRSGRKKK